MAVSISPSQRTGVIIGVILSERAAVSNEGIKADTGSVSGLSMNAARFKPGAISESSSSHLPPSEASLLAKPVAFPLGRSSRATMLLTTGSATFAKTIGIVRVSRWTAAVARVAAVSMMSGLQADQLCRERSYPIGVSASITKVDPHIAAIDPTQARKRLRQRRDVSLCHEIVFVAGPEHADPPHAVALLRPRR
jgi:hypothetical protein